MKARLIVPALIGLMFAAAAAHASEDCRPAPREQWKSEADARAAAEAMGYTVTRVEASGGCYEVTATDKRGKAVEVKFDATDMKLVSRKFVNKPELASR